MSKRSLHFIKPSSILVFVLGLQNLLYFAPHWFFGASFTGDFVKPYHATPHYLIQAYQAGVGVDWIPFAGMGYPTFLNLQSGLYYPVFWLFAALGLTYSIKAAVVVQCLTILLGGIGFSFLARAAGLSWAGSLLAGAIYQSFGGFVLNSMHPDIVRGYALMPWMLTPFVQPTSAYRKITILAILIMPFSVYALWTGGYPGQTIAFLFAAGILALARAVFGKQYGYTGILIAGLAIGTLLAAPAILPAALHKTLIARAEAGSITRDYTDFEDIFALIYDTDSTFFDGDPTMKSLYVGVPALALFLIGIRRCDAKCRIWLYALALVSLVMSSSLFASVLPEFLSPLRFSRFPFSDYKVLFVAPLIFIAAYAYDNRYTMRFAEAFALLAFVAIGNAIIPLFSPLSPVYMNDPKLSMSALPENYRYLAIVTSCIVVSGFLLLQNGLRKHVVLAVIVLFVMLDWSRIHWKHYLAALDGGVAIFDFGSQFESNGTPFADQLDKLGRSLANPPPTRPARIDIGEKGYAWRGYYSGEYLMRDWGGAMQLTLQRTVISDDNLRSFAQEPWTAVWLNGSNIYEWEKLQNCDARPLQYSTDQISYEIKAPSSGTYVVNELFYPGWRALVTDTQSGSKFELLPFSVSGFRAYNIPAGQFSITESFDTPHQILSLSISIAAMMFYVCYAIIVKNKSSLYT